MKDTADIPTVAFVNIFYEKWTRINTFYKTTHQASYIGTSSSILENVSFDYSIPAGRKNIEKIGRGLVNISEIKGTFPVDSPISQAHFDDIYNMDRFYEPGFIDWLTGEQLRKSQNITEAIPHLINARKKGYCYPELYISYAKCCRDKNDYTNELLAIAEALDNTRSANTEVYSYYQYRWNSPARKYLEKKRKEKELQEIKAKKSVIPKRPPIDTRKPVCMMNDDGEILKIFPSLSQASTVMNVSPKCIRDAANGKQKHAAGYCWKYQ